MDRLCHEPLGDHFSVWRRWSIDFFSCHLHEFPQSVAEAWTQYFDGLTCQITVAFQESTEAFWLRRDLCVEFNDLFLKIFFLALISGDLIVTFLDFIPEIIDFTLQSRDKDIDHRVNIGWQLQALAFYKACFRG